MNVIVLMVIETTAMMKRTNGHDVIDATNAITLFALALIGQRTNQVEDESDFVPNLFK